MKLPLAAGVAVLLAGSGRAADYPADRAARWEKEVAAVEAKVKAAGTADGVLFIGSSSIVRWDLKKGLPILKPVNAGFGGSETRDVVHFLPRLLGELKPRAVVVYGGDNDLAAGRTPAQVRDDFAALVKDLRARRPGVPVVFIAVKPSILRAGQVAKQAEANKLVKKACDADPLLRYLDVVPLMLGKDGNPKPELFVKDGLHMSPAGYAVWNDALTKLFADWPPVKSRPAPAAPVAP